MNYLKSCMACAAYFARGLEMKYLSVAEARQLPLQRQRAAGSDYLVGERLSACDLYWATFSLFVSPLPQEDCANA
jgi:glutathione S-transferase